ncbi:MAG: DUF1343 domain-containing protein [Lentimicrobiaceae bacterium]|jgi:uncharacterized protein YbbC (DUF1343 family)|nr:DUF1343 domain-containing protein [Lentimicrobiaceae bacterium]
MRTPIIFLFVVLLFGTPCCNAQQSKMLQLKEAGETQGAAARIDAYKPYLIGKKVGVVANQSSLVYNVHLIDTLLTHNIKIVKIFTPEHGFKGTADAGALIKNSTNTKTALPIVSLYGNNKKPTADDLKGIDILLFDLQDVGVRFYTYISTLTYVMEACAEQNIPVIVLDRPNPNGYYIDGPILEPQHRSFVGLHAVPIVYGLTIGEYSLMVNGEGWLENNLKCALTVIPMTDYDRYTIDKFPVSPSPNLPNYESIYLYPSLCLFEGTVLSVGRGTDFPFQVFGHPNLKTYDFSFVPQQKQGASKPKFEGERCYGLDLRTYACNFQNNKPYELQLDWLLDAYKAMNENSFFLNYFEKLTGTSALRKQIESGATSEQIRESWQKGLDAYKKIRIKYLLYPDL